MRPWLRAVAASLATGAMGATAVLRVVIAMSAVVTTALVVATVLTVRREKTVAHAWEMPLSVRSAMRSTTPRLHCASWQARPMARH
ncbi:hypothetical protein D3C72_1505900 [compost metagenome]